MTEFEQKLIKALIRVRDARNDPETVKSIVDKAIGAEEDVIPIEEPDTPIKADEEWTAPENLKEGDHITDANGTEHVVLGHKDGNLILETMDGKKSEVPYSVIEKELAGGTAHISSTNVTIPKEGDHFGEEQAEGLDNLLEGLRDTPHDNRW